VVGGIQDLGVAGIVDMHWGCAAHSNEAHPNTAVSRPASCIRTRLVGTAGVLLVVEIGEQPVGYESLASKGHLQPVGLKHGTCQNRPSHLQFEACTVFGMKLNLKVSETRCSDS
jgi:hypothetical protein